jgi:hypothetical protein
MRTVGSQILKSSETVTNARLENVAFFYRLPRGLERLDSLGILLYSRVFTRSVKPVYRLLNVQ